MLHSIILFNIVFYYSIQNIEYSHQYSIMIEHYDSLRLPRNETLNFYKNIC